MKSTALSRIFTKNSATFLGWCVLLFAGFVAWLTSRFDKITEETRSLPPDFFPYALVLMLVVLALVLLFEGFRKKESPILGLSYDKADYRRLLLVIATMAVYTFAQDTLGFLVASILVVVAMQVLLGEKKVLRFVISAIAIPGTIFFLFEIALNVPLPGGFLY